MAGVATAMILAAGRGERMRPLTDTCPKPLLPLGGKPLIVYQIEALARAGHRDIAVNAAHLADRLIAALGDGAAFGVRLVWSREPEPLETAGGIATALPLLATGPVLIVSGDIRTAYDYAALAPTIAAMRASPAAPRVHLVMVPNPPYHPRGDFALLPPERAESPGATPPRAPKSGRIVALPSAPLSGTPRSDSSRSATAEADSPAPLTFGNIGIYDTALFAELPLRTKLKLLPLFRQWIVAGLVSGERFDGAWANVGTPDDLARLDAAQADPA